MVDVRKPATLRGFHVSVADIGDQMHLCHPLLSFEGDSALYLAHRLDWQNDPEALAIADPSEASALGTLLPPTCRRPIASGEGLVAVGAGLVQAAAAAEVELLGSEIPFARVDDSECWIGVATPALYTDLRTRLAEDARAAFDEGLEDAARCGSRLSERGDAALLLMRKCGPRRRDDLAIRQLAGARQNREFDLYRRLLIRFALELDTQESVLDERVKRHYELVDPKAIDESLAVPAPNDYVLDWDTKNNFVGIKKWVIWSMDSLTPATLSAPLTLIFAPAKADPVEGALEKMFEQHAQLPPDMMFRRQDNPKADLGMAIEAKAETEISRMKAVPPVAAKITNKNVRAGVEDQGRFVCP